MIKEHIQLITYLMIKKLFLDDKINSSMLKKHIQR